MRPSVARRGGFGRRSLRPAPDGAPYGARSDAAEVRRKQGASRRALLLAAALAAIRARSAAATGALRLVALGDSLTAGYGLPESQAFPARLEAWLRRQGISARVVNAGVSGDTTAGGLARLDWALADKPDLVILALGANDALRGIDPAIVRANLDKMMRKIEAAGARLLLLGMRAPPNWGEAYRRDFDLIFPDLAHAHRVPLYPFILEGVAMQPKLNQADGLHPNARGVAVMVDHIGPVVAQVLGHPARGGS